MSFGFLTSHALDAIGENLRYDVKKKSMKDPPFDKRQKRILDNTHIPKWKSSAKSENTVILLGVLFVSAVVTYACVSSYLKEPIFATIGENEVTYTFDQNDHIIKTKNLASTEKIMSPHHSNFLWSRSILPTSYVQFFGPNITSVLHEDDDVTYTSLDADESDEDNTKRHIFNDSVSAEYSDFLLPHSLVPLSYIVYLAPNLTSSAYSGMVKIRVRCTAAVSKIVIHTSHHDITKYSVKTVNVTDIDGIFALKFIRDVAKEMLVMELNSKLVVDYDYDLYFGFKGVLTSSSDHGIYKSSYRDGEGVTRPVVSSLFKPGNARRVFPCFDEPKYTAHFELIVAHDKSFVAASNMPLDHVIVLGKSGYVETFFQRSPPISPYHLSFFIADYAYQELSSHGLKFGLYAPKGRMNETKVAGKMISDFFQYYQELFGVNYTLSKLDVVSITDLPVNTDASPGLIQISEKNFLLDSEDSSAERIEHVAQSLGEALAKQWFGCIATMKWWSDMWFTDSIAIYLGTFAPMYFYPSWDLKTQSYYDLTDKALKLDDSIFAGVVSPKGVQLSRPWYDSRYYLKGAAVFSMFASYLGKESFNKIVKSYMKKYENRLSSPEEFLIHITKNDKSEDLIDMTTPWFTKPGFPLVTMSPETVTGQHLVKQKRFLYNFHNTSSVDCEEWWIPFTVKPVCNDSAKTYILNVCKERFLFPNCSLFKANYGARGFYRFSYTKEDLSAFLDLLKTNHTKLPAVDRANLLSDIFELTRFNHESLSTALDFTKYLKEERHFVPYKIALSQLHDIADVFAGTSIQRCIKEYIKEQTEPVLQYLNTLTKHNHLQRKLLALLVNEAVQYDHLLALKLDNLFLQWVISNSRNKLSSDLRSVIFNVGITRGSTTEWNFMFSYLKKTPSVVEQDVVLQSLVLTKNMTLIESLLDYAATASIEEKTKIWERVCENKHGGQKMATELVTKFLSNPADNLKVSEEALESMLLNCFGSGNTVADLNQIDVFDNAPPQVKQRIIKNGFWRALEKTLQRVDLLKRKEEIEVWFKRSNIHCLP